MVSSTNPTVKAGAPSWHIRSDGADAWVTVRGAQVGPVDFHADDRRAQPYSLAPWAPGSIPGLPPLLDALRGDFFCLPFGPQTAGPQHGETASGEWTLASATESSITAHMETTDTSASFDRTVSLRPGQTALYQETRIERLDGLFSYGAHPILDFSREPPGGARISTSAMSWCSTNASMFADPAAGETQVLAVDAIFDDLSAVPRADGQLLDLSRYPSSPGHEDLVMMVNDPAAGRIGWSAVAFDGFVWFALKDVRSFPATLLWVSNGGRTQPPWSGAHTSRMGIEDVCSYFADGLEASRAQPLSRLGIPTARRFTADQVVTLRTVQGVAFTPARFGRVTQIDTDTPGQITIVDEFGGEATTEVDWSYVLEGASWPAPGR